MVEKCEECPSCGEIKRWLYDAQICATCGYGDRYAKKRAQDTESENERLRAALEWYAGDGSTYDRIDVGQRARAALGRDKQ
jgi:Zn ribbon nucleic-acid-binding protein